MSMYSENWHIEVELWLKNLMQSRCREETVYIKKKKNQKSDSVQWNSTSEDF